MLRRWPLLSIGILLLIPCVSSAASPTLTFRHKHFLFTLSPSAYPAWETKEQVWLFEGKEISPPSSFLVDGDSLPPLPEGVTLAQREGWNREEIRSTIEATIGRELKRDPGSVTISRDDKGKISFEGIGLPGREVDSIAAAELTARALVQGVSDIVIPIIETQPRITVIDPSLQEQGIKEVVTVGESDFDNSPANRRHNIAVGLSKFNGHVIPTGTTFSFGKTLGRVDGSTGYLKELVIKGQQTIPDFGGGLCQVSTTAYRGVWEYGFPITQRQNHSYTVSHYSPQGTDATVYPPYIDLKFTNDLANALLIQTYAKDDKAYFIFYGTKDKRRTELIGPFNWDLSKPPPDRTEYTLELKPGEKKKVGERVPGMKTMWFRFVTGTDGEEKMESVFSFYEARPLYYLVGVTSLPEVAGSGSTAVPTIFMEDKINNPASPPRSF